MRVLRWERYVPDFEDNRARHRAGDPALIVELRAMTSRVYREWWALLYSRPQWRERHKELAREFGDATGYAVLLNLATFDDELGAFLWQRCVRGVEVPDGYIEGLATPIRDGAALWAAREELDSAALYSDVFAAILMRGEL